MRLKRSSKGEAYPFSLSIRRCGWAGRNTNSPQRPGGKILSGDHDLNRLSPRAGIGAQAICLSSLISFSRKRPRRPNAYKTGIIIKPKNNSWERLGWNRAPKLALENIHTQMNSHKWRAPAFIAAYPGRPVQALI